MKSLYISPALRCACCSLRTPRVLRRSVYTIAGDYTHTASPSLKKREATSTDWNIIDEFFTFTRGRFVVNEKDQLRRRHIQFNMNELVQVAAKSVGSRSCVSVKKCLDGMYNKCFVLVMDDGQEVIAKVPNPNAGVAHFTTASEVATMDFARNILGTPVPKVHAWKSRAEHPVGAEYIIMEKVSGIQLSKVWNNMTITDKVQLRLNLALHQEVWLSVSFREFGGLYYSQDLPGRASEEHLYTNLSGQKKHDSRFTIGPMTGRDWSDCGRAGLKCDRGPCKKNPRFPHLLTYPGRTPSDYRKAVGLREFSAVSSITPPPRQTVMVCGPGLYQPKAAKKFSAIESYFRIYDALIPDDSVIVAPYLWHNDLHEENIFVDPENPTQITGIIDWQSNDLLPLFDHNPDPAFIQHSGPTPETLDEPELGDTSAMSYEERAETIRDYYEKALFIASRKIASKKTAAAYRAIEYQKTEAFELLTIARRIFEFGEAHFHALTVGLRDAWPDLPRVEDSTSPMPFPLDFDDARLAEIEDDVNKSVHGMQIMNDFRARLGPLWPDKDAVTHEQYDEAKATLRELKDEVIAEFSRSEEDKIEFEKQWPFDD